MSVNCFSFSLDKRVDSSALYKTFNSHKGYQCKASFDWQFNILKKDVVLKYLEKKEIKPLNYREYHNDYFDLAPSLQKAFLAKQKADYKRERLTKYKLQNPLEKSFDFQENCQKEEENIQFEEKNAKNHIENSLENNENILENIVDTLNECHAIVHTSQFYVLTEKLDENGCKDFILESKQSLQNTYENQCIKIDGRDVSYADIWLKSTRRRTFDSIIFDPKNLEKRFYNIWQDYTCKPLPGISKKFWLHVQMVICGGNMEYYNYIRKWLAFLIQKPHCIPEVAIVLRGEEGIGKGIFVKTIGSLLGKHYVPLDNLDRLTTNFNSHMKYGVLVFVDEAAWQSNNDMGKIKFMITEEYCYFEQKGKDAIQMKNFRHFIFATNSDIPVHISARDRRFFVLEVSNAQQGKYDYFQEILSELENGGRQAILHDLLTEDISDFNPRSIPINDEAFAIKILSCSSIEQYIYECLKNECFDMANETPSEPWRERICKTSIFDDYKKWCTNQGYSFKDSRQFWISFKRLVKYEPVRTREGNIRSRDIILNPITECKKLFEKYFKTNDSIWNEVQ